MNLVDLDDNMKKSSTNSRLALSHAMKNKNAHHSKREGLESGK